MNKILTVLFLATIVLAFLMCNSSNQSDSTDTKVDGLIKRMTLDEKIGQLVQKNGDQSNLDLLIEQGKVGSVLNLVNPADVNKVQRIAVEKSRLGIPLLIGRDVVHGFRTIFPIPLAQAASWNTDLVKQASRIAATEAASQGVRWSFAPMIDVSRDPRWGRIAEGFGEDHFLTGEMGVAVVQGFQSEELSNPTSIAACAKHFAAYGWAEGGRDYNSANISENDLMDIILPPFKKCLDAGAATVMTAFNDINGIPASGHAHLTRDLLRTKWGFDGLVVSDWASISQMETHGYTKNLKESAFKAFDATVDMEMVSEGYEKHLKELISEGQISEKQVDDAVRGILKLKFKLGLFDNPYVKTEEFPDLLNSEHLDIAKKLAQESSVLLKNNGVLPIPKGVKRISVIGPLADAPHDQLGTWIFDGDKKDAVTPLASLQKFGKDKGIEIIYHRALRLSRSKEIMNKNQIISDVNRSDLVLLFLGEESILSGEAHSRANIDLPGVQKELVKVVAAFGKPIVATILAGRPITFGEVEPMLDAVLFAWHPGTMAGPAITEILFGEVSPSGKLPITFPHHVGQIPIYYNHKKTGKPASNESWIRIDDIPEEAVQYSLGNTSHYLDYGFEPMYPFGYGLSYSTFEIYNAKLEKSQLHAGDSLKIFVEIKNTGQYDAAEVIQLYTQQLIGSRVRPVKELKAFKKIFLKAGESVPVSLSINAQSLGFHNPDMKFVVEPGAYNLWVGNSSQSGIRLEFEILQ